MIKLINTSSTHVCVVNIEENVLQAVTKPAKESFVKREKPNGEDVRAARTYVRARARERRLRAGVARDVAISTTTSITRRRVRGKRPTREAAGANGFEFPLDRPHGTRTSRARKSSGKDPLLGLFLPTFHSDWARFSGPRVYVAQ